VATKELRGFLAGLPLDALELPDELRESRSGFGLQTLGEVASLPPGPLAARLGPEAALLSRLARGEDTTALAARAEPERFEEGEELEWDASSVEPLLFVWKALLDRLVQRLCARGLMARELYLQLRLADGSWDERSLDLAAPTREVAALLQLLRLSVEGRPPPAGARAAAAADCGGAVRRFWRPAAGDRRGCSGRAGSGERRTMAHDRGVVDGRADRARRIRPGAVRRTFGPRGPRAGHRNLADRGGL